MASDRLVVDFERERDGAVVLRVSGKLERATVPLLDGVLRALRDDAANVTVDLTGVEHIDADGLELLLRADRDAAAASVAIVGVRESLRSRHREGEEGAE